MPSKPELSAIRREAGRKGGLARTEAKSAASRLNGAKHFSKARTEWLRKHGLKVNQTAEGYSILRVPGPLMQTVTLHDTPEEAINNWASAHGVEGPNKED